MPFYALESRLTDAPSVLLKMGQPKNAEMGAAIILREDNGS